jgi:hypothetical protein
VLPSSLSGWNDNSIDLRLLLEMYYIERRRESLLCGYIGRVGRSLFTGTQYHHTTDKKLQSV